MTDLQELQDKAKSNYGKYSTTTNPNKALAWIEKNLLKRTIARSYINGAITTGVLVFWFFTKNSFPVLAWAMYTFGLSIFGIWYWRSEQKRLSTEVQRIESEMKGLAAEIKDRQAYFENLKDQINKSNLN